MIEEFFLIFGKFDESITVRKGKVAHRGQFFLFLTFSEVVYCRAVKVVFIWKTVNYLKYCIMNLMQNNLNCIVCPLTLLKTALNPNQLPLNPFPTADTF